MIINFDEMPAKDYAHFKGGEKAFNAKIVDDGINKILRGTLVPGATIGYHCHEDSSEIIFILSGTGKVLYDDKEETVSEGMCHYCAKGHSHSLINESDSDLVFYAVVPVHR